MCGNHNKLTFHVLCYMVTYLQNSVDVDKSPWGNLIGQIRVDTATYSSYKVGSYGVC